jgi:hypothetical protein
MRRRIKVALAVAILAAVHCVAPAGSSESNKKGDYALGPDRCGSGALSFPRLRIDMKAGFCAGLVASEEDRLKFPRSIVQIPGQEMFVIVDMGGWGRTDGRLLVLDPLGPEGKRVSEALTGIEYPFGLAIGPDKKAMRRRRRRSFVSIRWQQIRAVRSKRSFKAFQAAR